MSPTTPETAGFLPGTVWTRADKLRPDEHVFVRFLDEDLWATVASIKRGDDADHLSLHLRLDRDGSSLGSVTHTPNRETIYLRQIPSDRDASGVRPTTGPGLAAAARVYRQDWARDGTVIAHLPTRIARQLLHDRGWEHVHDTDGAHHSWRAPNGDQFWQTDEALQHALAAECADARPVRAPERPTARQSPDAAQHAPEETDDER